MIYHWPFLTLVMVSVQNASKAKIVLCLVLLELEYSVANI